MHAFSITGAIEAGSHVSMIRVWLVDRERGFVHVCMDDGSKVGMSIIFRPYSLSPCKDG